MEHENTPQIDVKTYKKEGRAAAEAFLKRRKEARRQAKKEIAREEKRKVKQWKSGLKALDKKERKAQKKAHKAYKKRLARTRILITWAAVLVVIVMVINAASPLIHNIGAVMSQSFTDQTTEAIAAREAGLAFAPRISDEGMILLKNENDLLPLSNKKVNIFGDDAYNFKYSGGGSGAVDLSNCVTLFEGLEMAGIEYNPELHAMYGSMGYDAEASGSNNIVSMVASFLFGAETEDIDSNAYLTEEVLSSARAYSDQAIVVLSNDVVESSDSSLEALKLTPNRQALIRTVAENFDHVIVIVNVGNATELGIVDEYDSIEAVVWTGIPGTQGCVSLGKVLAGEINPSGRLVDTYAYDISSAPASENFGSYKYDNLNMAFINYNEGIYIGYRYYETRYAGDETGYWDAVQYPFGYGLSYTDFAWETVNFAVDDENVSWEVKVTNTGAMAGKDVVQLYFSAPYIPGGIEKSAIELADYGKTSLLEPGASETLTLSFPVRDMSSYDMNTEEAYVLDAGTYEIKLARNVHETVEVQTYDVAETVVYDTDEVTGTAIENRFDYAGGDLVYLSRNDWEGTYPDDSTASYTASEELLAAVEEYNNPAPSTQAMPTTGADNGILLKDLAGLDYDDPKWEQFLDQLTYEEMRTLFSEGGWHSVAIDRLGIPDTRMLDGPAGINSMYVAVSAAAYPTEMMVASTWNEELAYELGAYIGAEAAAYDVQVWYAPAMNLHRTAQGGRNFEYYSEDPVLSGVMAASTIRGAQDQGIMVTIKHFAMNNEETNARSGIYCWSNEQTIRELYLRPFEISVKEGGATGAMSAFTFIGHKWSGANPELLQDVLRDEWGFVGMVSTDAALAGFMDAALACCNGNDLMLELGLANSANVVDEAYKLDPVGITLGLRDCVHNICYSILNYTKAVK